MNDELKADLTHLIRKFKVTHQISKAAFKAADLHQILMWDKKFKQWVMVGALAPQLADIHPREFCEFFCDVIAKLED
jgi:hypothetical protein